MADSKNGVAVKTKVDGSTVVLTEEEAKKQLLKNAQKNIENAKNKEDLIVVWKQYYMTVGHKQLGRMMIGTYKES